MNTLLSVNPEILEDIIVPLGICVVLPCLIVFLVMWARRNEMNRKTEVALKAIEKGAQIDPDFFITRRKTKKENVSIKSSIFGYLIPGFILTFLGLAFCVLAWCLSINAMLIPGTILFFLGLAFFVIYFMARNQFAAEIRAEEEKVRKAE